MNLKKFKSFNQHMEEVNILTLLGIATEDQIIEFLGVENNLSIDDNGYLIYREKSYMTSIPILEKAKRIIEKKKIIDREKIIKDIS
jgi:hypothetical protein